MATLNESAATSLEPTEAAANTPGVEGVCVCVCVWVGGWVGVHGGSQPMLACACAHTNIYANIHMCVRARVHTHTHTRTHGQVAVVVDPIQSVKGKVVIDCFR